MWWSLNLAEAVAIILAAAFMLVFADADWVRWRHRIGVFVVYCGLLYAYQMTEHYRAVILAGH